MAKKKLVIVSASSRIKKEPKHPILAIERYDGMVFRILRKCLREGKLGNIDVLILTEKHGLIWSNDPIPYYEPYPAVWGTLSLNKNAIRKLREDNREKLKQIVNHYSEIYVNIGVKFAKLIEGFENFTTCKITHATGKGFGLKGAHMKEWILSQ